MQGSHFVKFLPSKSQEYSTNAEDLLLVQALLKTLFLWLGGWLEKLGLKLTSAKVEVQVEAELCNI